ncbi:importin-alpha re-exporter [Aphanothece sacrum FPU1]|uniref:Importin-alpha re-exporter n=1 Tax=Aphanothece sacrum FPU1 TaxID=1920663 RepID=A0A401IJH8_APHSA|nr:importin-alpha re-exporter [Aphanothece sacrum FPU1]GBF85596.1 importin-alpha re-exporter [Aphanothece sacrum FPU3]
MRRATICIRSTEPTEVPPYFWTIKAIILSRFYDRKNNNLSINKLAKFTGHGRFFVTFDHIEEDGKGGFFT